MNTIRIRLGHESLDVTLVYLKGKLFIKAEPGALLGSGANLETVRTWPAQTEITVAGVHFVQEDSPDEIGQAIASWMLKLRK